MRRAGARLRARAPRHRACSVAADPVDRRAREAAHRLRRRRHARRRPARQHLDRPSSPRSARSSRSTAGSPPRRRSRPRDYFPGIWDTNAGRRRARTACPGTSTRGCCSTARDLLARGRLRRDAAARLGRVAARAWRRCKRAAGPALRRSSCRPTSSSRCWHSALQAGSPLLRDGGTRGAFSRPGLPARASTSTSSSSGAASRRRVSNNADRQPLPGVRARHLRMYITGPWNLGEFRRRLPPALQDGWATAPLPGPDGPRRRRSPAARAWCCSARSRTAGRGVAADRVPVAARASSCASTRLTGDLPARREAWRDAGARRATARLRAPSPSSSSACAPTPEGARVGADRAGAAARRRARAVRGRAAPSRPLARARRARRPHPREAALAAGARAAAAGAPR